MQLISKQAMVIERYKSIYRTARQTSEHKMTARDPSEAPDIWVSKGNLTTKARLGVVGRNTQLDKGAGRQIWKCLDPLNCEVLDASCVSLHLV